MENIDELHYGVLGTAPKFGLREEIEFVPLFKSSKQRRKRKFNVVFVQVVKKSTLHVIYLLGLFRLTFSLPSLSPSPSSLLPGFLDVRKESEHVLRKTKRLPSFPQIYMLLKIRSINELLRFSGTDIWVENKKKVHCLRKYIEREDITRWREVTNFIFEWQNNIILLSYRTSAASG